MSVEYKKVNVSVLMSVYKEPIDILDKAIRSILGQTYRDFEYIIILDNPENQNAIQLINGYGDDRIHLSVNEANMGLVKSLNRGISLCSGEYIARMDADDISLPDRIQKQLAFIVANDLDIIGADIEIMHDEKEQGKIITCPKRYSTIVKAIVHDNCVKHPVWMMKKSVYDSLGGYRDIFSCEDYDFLLRAILAGYRLGNAPIVGLRYRQNPDSISRTNRAYQQTVCEYLKKLYKKKDMSSEEAIKAYLFSGGARKKMEALEEYIIQRQQADIKILFSQMFYKTIFHHIMYHFYISIERKVRESGKK